MKNTERPILAIKLTLFDKILEGFTFVTLLAFWVYTLLHYKKLPEVIPTHFDVMGQPDGYGLKWTIFALPVASILFYLALIFLVNYPHKFNYAVPITKKNALVLYTISTQMIRVLKLMILLVFFVLEYQTVQKAMFQKDIMGYWVYLVVAILVAAPISYYTIKSIKAVK
jgi:uncharacterized membrane protein